MTASISAAWLLKGFFDFSEQDPRRNTSQLVRSELGRALGLSAKALVPAHYPVGANRKYVFWWRDTDTEYAEAQFFASISQTAPILSLGVSLEKGRELPDTPAKERLNRKTWDWPRLLTKLDKILSVDVPAASHALDGRPVNIRLRRRELGWPEDAWVHRAFSFVNGAWFERHVGNSSAEEIKRSVLELDGATAAWGYVEFALDLGPEEAEGMPPADAAAILLGFRRLRARLRGHQSS